MSFILWLVATIFLLILTLLPLWRNKLWWVRSLEFPRLQFSVICLIILFLESVFLDLSKPSSWGMIVIATICFAYQAWWISPFTKIYRVEVKPAAKKNPQLTIRIMTANVLTPNRNSTALIQLVRENNPDILVTLESDEWWQSKLDVLEKDYHYTIKCPQDNLYGMHVYSRFPLSGSRVKFLVESDIPSIHTLLHLPAGQTIRAHFLHPAPPSPTENKESAERDAELIIVAKSVAETNEPVIITGDLNDVAWSETTRLFRKISGLLDPRVGRGMYNTFHAGLWFIRWPLDHLFHSSHFTLSSLRRLRPFGSDHFAIFAELVLDAERGHKQQGLTADSDDVTWAQATADEQKVSKTDVPQPGSS
jgi:endonuclease/exonuclease/phosphatase (EEP) superfamily protein YafD